MTVYPCCDLTGSRGTALRSRGDSAPNARLARIGVECDQLEIVMHRVALFAIAVLLLLVAAEMRLSPGEHNYSEPPPPDLWEHAQPPGRWSPSPVVVRAAGGISITYPNPSRNCALIVSTNPHSSYTLTSADRGVAFDVDADGNLDQVAWTEAGTDVAFLALDRNGDGRISTGQELIGDRTVPGVRVGVNALAQLAEHPGTWGAVDSDNPLFARLRLWTDANHNGVSEDDELRPAGGELAAIGLGYTPHRRLDGHGNQSRYRGFVHLRTEPGRNRALTPEDDRIRRRYIYEVCLVTAISP